MFVKQISIFVENKPGRLMSITKVLKEGNIDIKALSIADTKDFGILRIIVNDTQKALDILKKADCTVTTTDVIAAGVEDRPGGVADMMQALYENQISVEYMYAFAKKIEEKKAFAILRLDNNEKALKVLADNGIKLLSAEDITTL